jgi:glycine dehydrogenase
MTLTHADFATRHCGSKESDLLAMLEVLGLSSLDELSNAAVPEDIRINGALSLPPAISETDALNALREMLSQNRLRRCFIGLGFTPALLPTVIQRNVLENPGWYTQYTPYQAEVAQGRLEALFHFQTMVGSLTGLPLANASLLDEATAAAEAMAMCFATGRPVSRRFLISPDCHPQTIAVVKTRAKVRNIEVVVADPHTFDFGASPPFALLDQYPNSNGRLRDPKPYIERAHANGTAVILATCPLALCVLATPGELGADVAIGSTQRFGLPMGQGGPHAAFLAATDAYKRTIPGRIVGQSKDTAGKVAYRLALQTREQHIRRERATSNICTAQVLPALLSTFYAIYHGPQGLIAIAEKVAQLTSTLYLGIRDLGLHVATTDVFDTLRIEVSVDARKRILDAAEEANIELHSFSDGALGVTLGEVHGFSDVADLLSVFSKANQTSFDKARVQESQSTRIPETLRRRTELLPQETFHRYHTEHELLRYLRRLESRDLSLTTSMIPLGSCTMKLNATSEMLPITWANVANIHPFSDPTNIVGSRKMIEELSLWLAEITGMTKVSFQPNSGAQGEYAGLLAIHRYYEQLGDTTRNVCLIPVSAHGTNPASAVLAGFNVVQLACDNHGNIDLNDLRAKLAQYGKQVAALMVTYPSTHGVFESTIREICQLVHAAGGQVYLDGANLNAQVGLCRPGDYGADVCHLNLHKTFCIPHGGGGPGMGPIAVKPHLVPFLPGHPFNLQEGNRSVAYDAKGAVSSAPFGSASILPISWMYIRMMGAIGLRKATQVALLNANYLAKRLAERYSVLYLGPGGYCAHEFIIDARSFKKTAQIEVEDIAKRLMDYGYHAPTVSFPVPGTLMIEPTESESRAELDRFCDALLQIREEIAEIERGTSDAKDNVLKFAPHTAQAVTADHWPHQYSRQKAAFPNENTANHKFWPYVGRIDAAAGDRNLVCMC